MKIITGILAIVAIAGWYGTASSYSLGYDAGNKSVNADAETTAYRKGNAAGIELGRKTGQQECSSAIDQRGNERLQSVQEEANKRIQKAYEQGIQAGAAAEAKAIIDQHLVIARTAK